MTKTTMGTIKTITMATIDVTTKTTMTTTMTITMTTTMTMTPELKKIKYLRLTDAEEHEEDAEEPGDDRIFCLVVQFGISSPDDREVGALCSPEGRRAEPHDDGCGHHRGPHGVSVGSHVEDVAPEGHRYRPPVPDHVDDDLRQEHARQHQGYVTDARCDHSHAFVPVQTALQARQTSDVEDQQKRNTDQAYVFHDFSFFSPYQFFFAGFLWHAIREDHIVVQRRVLHLRRIFLGCGYWHVIIRLVHHPAMFVFLPVILEKNKNSQK